MNELLSIDAKNIWHPFTPLVGSEAPILITHAEGVYLYAQDGRKIIDAISSWWVNIHGHANPYIANAISKQAQTLEHVIFAGFTHEPAIKLSENLLTILPHNQKKIFFSDNGSTAVEVALKISMQYWFNQGKKKKKIIAINGAYHGDTFGAMSIAERSIFTNPFNDFLFKVDFIDFPTADNQEIILSQFNSLVKSGDVACFIFEPLVQAAAGMRMYSAEILDQLLNIARENDVVTIADEVFTGFGRTGKLFASEYLSHKPDIMTLSKGITGGFLPLGVTSCSDKIVSAFTSSDFQKTFFHGHSYTGNPLACSAANASFELLLEESCKRNIERITQQHQSFKGRILNKNNIKDVRSRGTILAIELTTNEDTSYSNSIRKKIYPFFLERNVLLRPLGNIIYIVPPYIISDEDLEVIYNHIELFIDSINE